VFAVDPLSPNGAIPFFQAASLKPVFIHRPEGCVSVYAASNGSSSPEGTRLLYCFSISPRNRYIFPSTLTNPNKDCSLPVQCFVGAALSLSLKDHMLK